MTMSNLKGSNLILKSLGSSFQPIPNKPSFLSSPLCRRKTLLPLPITMSNLKGSNLILNSPLLRSKRTLTPSSSSVFHQRSIETIKLREVLEIIKPLQDLGNPTDLESKYHPKLRSYSRTLPRLDSIYKTSDNEVKVDPGCGVNVWVRSYLDYDYGDDKDKKVVWFEATSNCVYINALASILFKGISGRPLTELTPDFFKLLSHTLRSPHISYHPSFSTESDFFDMFDILQNMLELIQCQCLILEEAGYVSDYDEAVSYSVKCWIKEKLDRGLSPVKLEVKEFLKLNFSIVIVSKEFLGKTYAHRDNMIHSLLKQNDYPIELPPFSVSIKAAKVPV